MKKIFTIIAISIPNVLFAVETTNFRDLMRSLVKDFFQPVLVIVALVIFFYFVWSIAQFILHADSAETRSSAKRVFIWGIFTLFVVASITAIIAFLLGEFNLGDVAIPNLPTN